MINRHEIVEKKRKRQPIIYDPAARYACFIWNSDINIYKSIYKSDYFPLLENEVRWIRVWSLVKLARGVISWNPEIAWKKLQFKIQNDRSIHKKGQLIKIACQDNISKPESLLSGKLGCPTVWNGPPTVWNGCPTIWNERPTVWNGRPTVWNGSPAVWSLGQQRALGDAGLVSIHRES